MWEKGSVFRICRRDFHLGFIITQTTTEEIYINMDIDIPLFIFGFFFFNPGKPTLKFRRRSKRGRGKGLGNSNTFNPGSMTINYLNEEENTYC